MTTRTIRDGKLQCALCHRYFDKAKYRTHVPKCGMSEEEEDEDQPVLKVCPFCGKQVVDLAEHCQTCTGGHSPVQNTYESPRSSPASLSHRQPTAKSSSRTSKKECPFCFERVAANEYEDHMDSCRAKPSRKPMVAKNIRECPICSETVDEDDYEDHVDNCRARSSRKPMVAKNTRECSFCSETVAANEYEDHMDNCHTKSSRKPMVPRNTKECQVCSEKVFLDDYEDHLSNCRARSSRKPMVAKSTRECSVCSKRVALDDYEDHMNSCRARSSRKPMIAKKTKECPVCSERIAANEYEDHVDNCNARSSRKSMIGRNTKECSICSERIAANEYEDHVNNCNARSSRKSMTARNTKECPICSEKVSLDDYEDHVDSCRAKSSRKSMIGRNTKECAVCSERIAVDEYEDHVDNCNARSSRKPMVAKNTKECPICSKRIAADEYEGHMDNCGVRSSRTPATAKKTKECPICSERIAVDVYENHMDSCEGTSSRRTTADDYGDHVNNSNGKSPSTSTIPKDTEQCFICSKAIAKVDFQQHVDECLESSSPKTNTKSAARSNQQSCFTCSSPVDQSKTSSYTVPCRARHIYCLNCLQRSMNEFIQSNTPPTCHSTLCDYQLSRYDVECLPLQLDIIQQLLPLVKTTQRPQCPLCLFYVDFNTMNDLQKHSASCNEGSSIPCEYCHCLYSNYQLDEHTRQCRNAPPSQQQQTFINFIMPRTKYPVTTQQIRVFLQHRQKKHLPIDAHTIVDVLAEFDGVFPFEVPTRDCDICAESYLYDDIFVVGCDESHKLCYGCFANSCTTKMKSNEILTCPMCTYQLQDGDLNQLQVSTGEKRQLLDYQTQKLFGSYTGDTQGIIKCPNKECKWVAEAQNPNDRFLVQCPLCQYEFCSLCNQQYHFRTTCQQIPELTQRWFFWCNTERGNYWQARAQADASFRAQLEDYQRQTAANTQRNQELRQRYDELLADEQYKAQNCRLCPKCGRVVQHLGGCDLMVCGRNYHGGDDQSGCGHGFNFSQAPAYAPLANTGPQQVRNDMVAPEQQKTVVHTGVQCDACHNEVQGIRFDCVHCSSLIFCEKCEQRSTLEHSNQNRDQNKQQHVFRLITTATNT